MRRLILAFATGLALLFCQQLLAQNTVKGKVLDQDKIPIPGYEITLSEAAVNLDEAVVVGYGVQKKGDLTGSVSSVNQKALKNAPVDNLTGMFGGKLPGLVSRQTTGLPGENDAAIFIRGISTTGNSTPLVLVDGVEREFSNLDPSEIANITILKDAASAAVYGVKGANGVILVTTKRGDVTNPTLTYNGSVSFSSNTDMVELLDGPEYGYKNVVFFTISAKPTVNPRMPDGTYIGYQNPLIARDESGFQQKERSYVQTALPLKYRAPWLKGLTARAMLSYDFQNTLNKRLMLPCAQITPQYGTEDPLTGYVSMTAGNSPHLSTGVNTLQEESALYSRYTGQAQVNYNGSFGDHEIGTDLVCDGKTIINFLMEDDVYMANFELFPDDIFHKTTRQPRTAIGRTADGKVVLMVVDGRNSGVSEGVVLTDLARLMRGVGCVDVMNLDGGGSSVFCAGQDLTILNRPSSSGVERAVLTMVGFAKP